MQFESCGQRQDGEIRQRDYVVEAPIHYILSRSFKNPEKLDRIFAITPVLCCVVSDPHDTGLAMRIHPAVIQIEAESAELWADLLANRYGQPVVVIGDADGLEAVYVDGRKEKVNA